MIRLGLTLQQSPLAMLFIWGHNQNHLFRNNHKKTYSFPQHLTFSQRISTCACGFDFLVFLTLQGQVFILYQNAIIQITNLQNVADVVADDQTIVFTFADGTVSISEFNPTKILNSEISFTAVSTSKKIIKAAINGADIFLLDEFHSVHYLTRNEWYETKTYSEPALIKMIQKIQIAQLSPGNNMNMLLATNGSIFVSTKSEPRQFLPLQTKMKFSQIANAHYQAAISVDGRLYIWGRTKSEAQPVEFGKITKQFVAINLRKDHGFALTEDGEAWAWGKNSCGELGLSDYEERTKLFPLITMSKNYIQKIFLGEDYTVCVTKQHLNNKNQKSIPFPSIYSHTGSTDKPINANNKPLQDILNFQTFQSKEEIQNKSPPTQINPSSKASLTKNQNHPVQRSKSKLKKQSFSKSKSPSTLRQKSPKHLTTHTQRTPRKQNQDGEEKGRKNNFENRESDFLKRINFLEEENKKLRRAGKEKDWTVAQITEKIGLLEDAIEEHEKSLTSRDHLMEEYRSRETQYKQHINQLEKSIQAINQARSSQMELSHLHNQQYYQQLYLSSQQQNHQQRELYLQKIHQYEQIIREQCSKQHQMPKESSKQHQMPKERRADEGSDHFERQQLIFEKNSNWNEEDSSSGEEDKLVENVIERIEANKHRISKSANKLISMLSH